MALQDLLLAREKTVGTKETRKALEHDRVVAVYVARDAEEHVVRPVLDLSRGKRVEVIFVDSMSELGRACGISVGAATAGILGEGSTVE